MGTPNEKKFEFTDEQLIDIVNWWIGPLQRGERAATQAEILKQFGLKYRNIDPRHFEKAKSTAFARGLVELHSNRPMQPVARIAELERKLVARFELRSAFVIDSDEHDSTALHRQLGLALGEGVSHALDFYPENMIIGLGSGRAIHFVVDSFRHLRKVNLKNVSLMSLTGTVYPEVPNQGQLFDADINTVEFARFFNQATTVRTVGYSIAHEDIPSVRRNTWLHDEDDDRFATNREPEDLHAYDGNLYSRHVPSMAIVGIGVLGPDHRLYKEVSNGSDRSSTMLDPIRADMQELIKLIEVISMRNKGKHGKSRAPYYPCADICHRFFFINPPPDIVVASHEKAAIQKRLEAVNRHMLTVTRTQLAKCPNVVLIAGGRDKLLAVKQLMQRGAGSRQRAQHPLVVRTICTDRETAEELLK